MLHDITEVCLSLPPGGASWLRAAGSVLFCFNVDLEKERSKRKTNKGKGAKEL